jgi:hypothetical protein
MTAKTAINAKNLEALGAERLAELLVEISAGNGGRQAARSARCNMFHSPVGLPGIGRYWTTLGPCWVRQTWQVPGWSLFAEVIDA